MNKKEKSEKSEIMLKAEQVFKALEDVPYSDWEKILHTIELKYRWEKEKVTLPSTEECMGFLRNNFRRV